MAYRLYHTDGFILDNKPFGEGGSMCVIFTRELGLLFALAQSARESHSKLRGNLQPLSAGSFSFVRGKNGWRVTHAEAHLSLGRDVKENGISMWARIFSLLRKLVSGEEENKELYEILESGTQFLKMHPLSEEELRFFEGLLVLRIVRNLGYLPSLPLLDELSYSRIWSKEILNSFKGREEKAIFYINEAIAQSGLG